MSVKYLTYVATAVIGTVAVKHPGGEAPVRHYPDGHAEIGSFYEVDLSEIDPNERLSRRYRLDSVTLASSATAVSTLIKAVV
jgi:hypothetical protein